MSTNADQNLLFGILALQLDFITREQLVEGMQGWVLSKDRPLADILQDAGNLSADNRAVLDAVVAAHLKQHKNEAILSLAAVSSIGSVREELSLIADSEVAASIPHISVAHKNLDNYATISAGESTSVGNRFRILRPHAQGGLGKVFVARDSELNREVALKEIQPQFADDPSARSRFMLEAEVTGGLEHPSIVPVYGLGTYSDGRPFYAMRFIRGDSLKDAIERYHDPQHTSKARKSDLAVELRQLLGRFIDVCQAIQYAHDRGVLHRDLKPGNIMLGKYGETLVVDWGLAKAQGESSEENKTLDRESAFQPASGSTVEATQMGSLVGTLQYMSPEQANGRLDLLGPATDVFALGATLYHLLTGQAPYQSATKEELVTLAQTGKFISPRQIKPTVPKALEAICLKAMERDCSQRYASAAVLLADIERWLADEPVQANAESVIERLLRWRRSHPRIIAGIAATALVGLVSLGVSSVLLGQKNQELANANLELQIARDTAWINEQQAREEKLRADASATEAQDEKKRADESAKKALEQKQKADESATAALEDRERLQKTLQFVTAAFYVPGNTVKTREMSASSLLVAAVAKAERSFAKEPLFLAELLQWLGISLDNLGYIDATLQARERVYEIHRDHFGPEHEKTLTAISLLAKGYKTAGQLDKAIPLFEELLRIRKTTSGPANSITIAAMQNLATAYSDAKRGKEAIAQFEEALKLIEGDTGTQVINRIDLMGNLANAYKDARRMKESFAMHREVIKLFKSEAPDDPALIQATGNLATAYQVVGNFSEAIPLYEETIQSMTVKFGADHRDTVMFTLNLALARSQSGDFEGAERDFLAAYQTLENCQPGTHAKLLLPVAIKELVSLYADWKKPEEAAKWTEKLKEQEQQ